jgi:hypothetical protein
MPYAIEPVAQRGIERPVEAQEFDALVRRTSERGFSFTSKMPFEIYSRWMEGADKSLEARIRRSQVANALTAEFACYPVTERSSDDELVGCAQNRLCDFETLNIDKRGNPPRNSVPSFARSRLVSYTDWAPSGPTKSHFRYAKRWREGGIHIAGHQSCERPQLPPKLPPAMRTQSGSNACPACSALAT